MNLTLPLERKWFEMTEAGVKTEDYRELTNYWLKRLYGDYLYISHTLSKCSDSDVYEILESDPEYWEKEIKPFTHNIMTLGYPKKEDDSRRLITEHKGIEIGEGKPEWGAEPGKIYFIIKHGKILNR